MNAVQFDRVSRHYGEVKAVDDISFQIPAGEFFTLLGPSGSGKTTCLRMIAGFEYPSEGEIRLFGEPCSTVPPYDRNLNTVFQDYALFPNMDVRDNIGYGLMLKGVPKAERYRKVDEMLELVRLPGVGNRKPGQLSGGQRQRIAIARALINQPRILLLDEPLGALDLKLREQMQLELKALQRQLGITFIFVTHDQQEALSMSDRICIFNQGKIEQIAAPDTIYDAPATPFVARFVGTVNLFEGEQARRLCGDARQMMVRPERIRLAEAGTPGWSGRCARWSTSAPSCATGSISASSSSSSSTTPTRARPACPVAPGSASAGRSRRSIACTPPLWELSHERPPQCEPCHEPTHCPLSYRPLRRLSTLLYGRPGLLLAILLGPPLLWLGIIYVGSLLMLLSNAFFGLDEFSGQIRHELGLQNFVALLRAENLDVILRTVGMSLLVTLACALLGFPVAYYMARYTSGKTRALFYVGIMLPLWSSYLVRVYAWKLILAKEGSSAGWQTP